MSNPPFKVKAIFEYTSPHDDDLHFPNGQVITVTEEEDDDWYSGEYVDASGVKQEGIFPKNFVEKYEPTAPPRPTRTARPKKESEAAPAPEPVPEPTPQPEPVHEPESAQEPEEEDGEVQEAPAARAPPPSVSKPQAVSSPPPPKQAEFPPPPAVAKPISTPRSSGPPPVTEKPSGGSFRDRIAAFNKAAPPVAPFKPGGLSSGGSNNFIKKPFVAPPPSKNAYVPVVREQPVQKLYKREEDPEIAAEQAETQEQAEKAGLAPTSNEDGGEEQPKPTSLKERIALLQKQQQEQAARHADAVQKKEKPKRPTKPRTESHEVLEGEDGAALERRATAGSTTRQSIDSAREEPTAHSRRKSSARVAPLTSGVQPRKSFGDGNEADMSGAGDTTEEPEEIPTSRDGHEEKLREPAPQPLARAPTAPSRQPDVGEEEGASEEGEEELEEEEEEDIDPEVRRKEELRARMAKMSGGMGMQGMFGAPMPMAAPKPTKKKSTSTSERGYGGDGANDASSPSSHAPPVPMIPLPGISRVRSPEEVNSKLSHDEQSIPVSAIRRPEELPDVEDVVPSQDRAAPPPGNASAAKYSSLANISVPHHEGGAPPIPGGRPAPPPVPRDCKHSARASRNLQV